MKKTNQTKAVRSWTAVSGIMLMMLASSCKKELNRGGTISEEDAATAITMAVSGESGGVTEQVDDAVTVASTYDDFCGTSFDSSISKTSNAGSSITYSLDLNWNWALTCSNLDLPQKYTFNFSGASSYDAALMSSNDNSTASFVITGLEPSANSYIINQNFQRNGTQQSKVRNKFSFSSTIILTSANIMVDKTLEEISSGIMAASISGTSSSGNTFSFTGTVTFLGNKKATLTINGGKKYDISW